MAQNPSKTAGASGYTFAVAGTAIAATLSPPMDYIASGQMTQPTPSAVVASTPTTSVDERLVDAKIAVAEARTDTKFAQLMGKIDLLVQAVNDVKADVAKLDTKVDTIDAHVRSSKAVIITTVIASLFAIGGLTYAGIQIFQSGIGLSAGAFQAGMSAAEVRAPAK